MLQAGTVPAPLALGNLTSFMDAYPRTGAATGELQIRPALGWNPLLMAQWFEYKISYILVTTFESACGYLPVLNSAFSIYRWKLMNDDQHAVLRTYFKPFMAPRSLNWVEWNVYFLAEDRVASDAIVKLREPAERGCCWNYGYSIKFVKQAKAGVEGQRTFNRLISARQKYYNGAWFALLRMIYSRKSLLGSSHNIVSLLFMFVQVVYYLLVIALKWFALGMYFVLFSLAFRTYIPDEEHIIETLRVLFVFLNFVAFCFSLAIDIRYITK